MSNSQGDTRVQSSYLHRSRRNRTAIITITSDIIRKIKKLKLLCLMHVTHFYFIWFTVTLPQKSKLIFFRSYFQVIHFGGHTRESAVQNKKIFSVWLVCLKWSSDSIYFINCVHTILLELWACGLPFFMHVKKDILAHPVGLQWGWEHIGNHVSARGLLPSIDEKVSRAN